MADEIIKVIEYFASSSLLIGIAIGSAIFFVIILVLVICVFVEVFSSMSKFKNRLDNINNRRNFR